MPKENILFSNLFIGKAKVRSTIKVREIRINILHR